MKSEYIQEISHYQIQVSPNELYGWEEKIRLGHSLPSEVVGYLLGRASAVLRNVKCVLCSKEVRKGTEVDWAKFPGEIRHSRQIVHQTCYEDYKKGGIQI